MALRKYDDNHHDALTALQDPPSGQPAICRVMKGIIPDE